MNESHEHPPDLPPLLQVIAFFLGKSPFWIGAVIGALGALLYGAFIRQ